MPLSPTILGVLAGLGASLAWALANIFIQRSTRLAGPILPSFWGQVLGAICLLPALWLFPVRAMPANPWWLLVGGVGSAAGYLWMNRAFQGGPVSVVSPVVSTWALVSAALGVWLLGEAMPAVRVLGALLVVGGGAGIAALARVGGAWHAPRSQVLLASAGSSLGFGAMVVAIGPVTAALGPVGTILVFWGAQWVVAGPFVLRRPLLPPTAAWGPIAAQGLLEVAGFLLLQAGSAVAPVTVVAPASSLSVLFTVAMGRLWLGERVGWDRWGLAVLVVLGVILLGAS